MLDLSTKYNTEDAAKFKYFPQKYLPTPEGGSSGSVKKERISRGKATIGGALGILSAFQLYRG